MTTGIKEILAILATLGWWIFHTKDARLARLQKTFDALREVDSKSDRFFYGILEQFNKKSSQDWNDIEPLPGE